MTGSRRIALGRAAAAALVIVVVAVPAAQELALKLRATSVAPAARGTGRPASATAGATASSASMTAPMTIELLRWSTDAERAPLLAALAAPPPPPPSAPAPAAGRGGRGGRGAAAPLSPAARLTAAIKAAPTVGFIWGDGPTGFSIKYAWSAPAGGGRRIVLITDRRFGGEAAQPPDPATADADFTIIEARVDGRGAGEAKASTKVAVDATVSALVLEGYEAAPAALKVTR